MKRTLSLTSTGPTVILLGLLSLVLLQACQSPINQEVKVTCGPSGSMGGDGESGGGIGCGKTDVALHSLAPLNAIVIDDAGVPVAGGQLPVGAKCDWVPTPGASNRICTTPGQPRCSYVPNSTCHPTYNLTTKRCDCGCFP